MNKDANYLILFLIILFIMWYSQGGRFGSGGIIMNPQGGDTTSAQNQYITGGSTPTPSASTATAPAKKTVDIFVNTAGNTTHAPEENITIRASYNNSNPIDITGWYLQNKNNEKVMIGYGSKLPYSAGVNRQEDIILAPNEEAVVVTGKSPIDSSFRLNLCTGYFSQYQTYVPALPQDCPAPRQTPGLYDLNDDNCIKLIEGQTNCRVPTVSNYLSDACNTFINRHLNYQGCVTDYGNNKDFSAVKKWYVYLGRDNEFWPGTRGKITLYDRVGNLVAETTY